MSDSSRFKPVTFNWLMKPVCDEFEIMFREMFDSDLNKKCWKKISTIIARQKWNKVLEFMIHVQRRAVILIQEKAPSADGKTDLAVCLEFLGKLTSARLQFTTKIWLVCGTGVHVLHHVTPSLM